MENLFTFQHNYTVMDEDYENRITIFNDGSLSIYQMQTNKYEPEAKNIKKEPNKDLLVEINSCLETYKNDYEDISIHECDNYITYKISIKENENTINIFNKNDKDYVTLSTIIKEIKKVIEKYYPNIINWSKADPENILV